MMTQAFYTGLSGLKTNQSAIDIVSDNLANTSTVGFRGYSSEFSSLFEGYLNTSTNNIGVDSSVGVGSQVATTVLNQTNGTLILSDKSTDLAIEGNGWFGIVKNGAPMYTRDGTFTFDKNRDLVTYDGFHVLGTMGGNIAGEALTAQLGETKLGEVGAQEKLNFPEALTFPPVPTSLASFYSNIGVVDEIRKVSAGIVDAQGTKNNLELTFTKSAVQTVPGMQWDVLATTKSLDGATIYDTQTGKLNFDSAGSLLSSTLGSIDNNGTPVKIDLGSGYAGITAINLPVVTGSSSANGLQGGDLLGYDINQNGEVIATFTNGKQSSVGKVALFHFQNDQGLDRVNGSRFMASSNSGEPIFFKDANGQNTIGANLRNFKLESSNVKYEVGLTDLIIYQRAYDANSKCITTADQMIQKALSMHR
jgi:flagellar hook protein FlgE